MAFIEHAHITGKGSAGDNICSGFLHIAGNVQADRKIIGGTSRDISQLRFAIYGMISNSTSVGGFKMNTRANVSMNDGLLEVLLVKKPRNPVELQATIAALLLNDMSNSCLHAFRASELKISSQVPTWAGIIATLKPQ